MDPETDDAIGRLYHLISLQVTDFAEIIKSDDLFGATFVRASQLDERIIRQSGAFILFGLDGYQVNLKAPQKSLIENIRMESSKQIRMSRLSWNKRPVRIKIANEFKRQMLEELNLLGINASTIYPDINSQAKNVNNMYSEIN